MRLDLEKVKRVKLVFIFAGDYIERMGLSIIIIWFPRGVVLVSMTLLLSVPKHELIANSGVDQKDTIMIGDTEHDKEVADALGIDLILVDHGHQCPTRLRPLHHKVLNVLN